MNCEQVQVPATITFGELQSLSHEDVASRISQQTALEICRRNVEDLGSKTVEVLSLWLRKLLRAYFSEAKCCIEVYKCLYAWFTKLKNEVNPENKTACDDLILLANDALSFAEWAKSKLIEAGERLVHTTMFFLLSIVNGYLQHSIERNVAPLKEHEPVAIDLHMKMLSMLKHTAVSSKKVHARITPLLRQLIEIADFLSFNVSYLHAFVKTSKTMTNICTHYSSLADLSQSMPDWLQETALHLCDTVLNNLDSVYNQDASLDKIEEHLRVSQAYLIMFHKLLSCGVKHMDKSLLDTIFVLLIGGQSRQLAKDISELVSKYTRPYILQLYELIYQLEDFQNYLADCLKAIDQTNEDYFDLCLDYITVVIVDDTEIDSHNCQTIQKLFEYLFRDASNFTNAVRYNRVLEVFGSLLHVADCLVLFKYFLMGLFHEDIMKSQVCADVLMICFRLEEANKSWSHIDVMQALDYFMKCNNLYTLFSQNVSQWHIQRMVKYFHKLSNNKQPLFSLRNYRYLNCVTERSEQDQKLWTMRIRRLLIDSLKDTEQFYEMLALMELLSTGQEEWPVLMSSNINELLRIHKSKLLANVYFKAALKLGTASQLRILEEAAPTKEIIESCWHVQKFLHAHNKLEFSVKTKLLAALETPLACTITTEIKYQKWDYRRQQSHRCNLSNLKRKRTDSGPKGLIQQLELNTHGLLQYSAEFDGDDVLQLRNIINKLTHILPT